MTLLLGPPRSGNTTLLLALARKLDSGLKVKTFCYPYLALRYPLQCFIKKTGFTYSFIDDQVKGEITYNGHRLDEFVPQKTSAYISQCDLHVGEMEVRETLDFSTRCQGVGDRFGGQSNRVSIHQI